MLLRASLSRQSVSQGGTTAGFRGVRPGEDPALKWRLACSCRPRGAAQPGAAAPIRDHPRFRYAAVHPPLLAPAPAPAAAGCQ